MTDTGTSLPSGLRRSQGMRASDFVPLERNTLKGFFVLHLASGIVLHGCTLHQKGDKCWIGLPSRPQVTSDNQLRRHKGGKILYMPVVEVAGKERREQFQRQALEAVKLLLED